MNCAPTAQATFLPKALTRPGFSLPVSSLADRGDVLITRPEPAASRMAQSLADQGWRSLLAPMLRIEQNGPISQPPRVQAVLVTSANALPALVEFDRVLPLLAVGNATAAQALEAGFTNVLSAGRDAVALAELTAAQLSPALGPLLLASGAGQGMALAADLRKRGFVVRRRVVYRSCPTKELPPDALAALLRGQIRHVMFFSADTARAFVRCIKTYGLTVAMKERLITIEALAISAQAANVLASLPWRDIRVASHPNQDELVALLT